MPSETTENLLYEGDGGGRGRVRLTVCLCFAPAVEISKTHQNRFYFLPISVLYTAVSTSKQTVFSNCGLT